MRGSMRTLVVPSSFLLVWLSGPATAWSQALTTPQLTAPLSLPVSSTFLSEDASIRPAPSKPGLGRLLETTIGDFRRLPSWETATLLSIGAVAAGFSSTIDYNVTSNVADSSAMLDRTLKPGAILGGKEFQFGAAFATLALGHFTGQNRVADVGGKLLRAQFLAQTVSGVIKVSANRTRPDGTNLSFPSGHTSVSFASATVLQREFGWKVGIPAYMLASYVGVSRIEAKRHFLSDVAFGAAVGIVAGRTVTVGSGDRRFALSPMAAPGGGGISFTWVGKQ
jgi:membrane-associated phospholipid phosphatase